MTKKDYVRFAAMIRDERAAIFAQAGLAPIERSAQLQAVRHLALSIANAFKADAPKTFKLDVFLDACDLYSEPRDTAAS